MPSSTTLEKPSRRTSEAKDSIFGEIGELAIEDVEPTEPFRFVVTGPERRVLSPKPRHGAIGGERVQRRLELLLQSRG